MELTGCPETTGRNCQFSLRRSPEERCSHLFRGGSLKIMHMTFFNTSLITRELWIIYSVLWPSNAQLFHKLSQSYMFRQEDRCSIVLKVLRNKSEGRWFDPIWCHWTINWHKSFWSQYGPEVDSASNRNEYRKYFLGVNAAGAYGWQPYQHSVPLSRNLGTLTFWNPLGHPRPVTGLLYCQLHKRNKGKNPEDF
jgi:hypothetical protein